MKSTNQSYGFEILRYLFHTFALNVADATATTLATPVLAVDLLAKGIQIDLSMSSCIMNSPERDRS